MCLLGCTEPNAGADAGQPCDGGGVQPCSATRGNLIVTIINGEDNTTVSGVFVRIQGPQNLSVPSDGSGKAIFSGIAAGPYNINETSSCFTSVSVSGIVQADQTTTVELHVRHIHAVITIKELVFKGNNVVEKDTTGDFTSPEWVKGRAQKDQSPIAYARNKKIVLNAKFEVTTAPCLTESIVVKGAATFGSASLEWTGTVTVNPGDTVVSLPLTSNNTLANEVGIFESNDISWQINPAGQGWSSAGTTRNILYVTLGDPSGSPNFWTLLDISCRAAAGKSTEDDFVKASFIPFHGTVGDGKGFKRKRDGVELTYYKTGASTPASGVFTCSDILSRADGTGRCGAWARFLVAMHQVHGITSSAVFGVVPVNATNLLIVKNCTFTGAGSLPVPFTHKGHTECVKNNGIFGQGKNNPQFTFGDHALVKHSTGIYDPSYGVGPQPDLKTWEDLGIAGIGQEPVVSFTFSGDRQFLPVACSPGFIIYTVISGDTLVSIAAKFGIASAAVLYNHSYNTPLRALRPPPGSVSPGDMVIIPRNIASKVAILKII